MGNTFGRFFRLTTFGESHGVAIGGSIDGCPAGLEIDIERIQRQLDLRRPGSTSLGTKRSESDKVEILSGIFEGKTTGTPIGFLIRNKDARPADYEKVKDTFRPSHADFTYQQKYGFRDYRGGGRASARETACRIVGGAIAMVLLEKIDVDIKAFVSSVGEVHLKTDYSKLDLSKTYENEVRCPDPHVAEFMSKHIQKVRKEGDSVGGIITCVCSGVPVGLGEPVFDKLHAAIGHAVLGINAVKGFEIGSGFRGADMYGSEHNDQMEMKDGKVHFKTNNSGGIQGGISNGADVYFRVAFKPVATISKSQKTVTSKGEDSGISVEGRHDPCVVPRAVPIVEAMTAMVLADFYLQSQTNKI